METNELPEVNVNTLNNFKHKSNVIVKEVVDRSMKYKDDVRQHGNRAEEVITEGIKMTTEMLFNAMSVNDVGVLDDQLQWAIKRLPVDGVSPEQVYKRFNIYLEVVNELFVQSQAKEISQFIEWMIKRQKELVAKQISNE
jgi:hypothetical protein